MPKHLETMKNLNYFKNCVVTEYSVIMNHAMDYNGTQLDTKVTNWSLWRPDGFNPAEWAPGIGASKNKKY
jgi:hypothetical protein